MSFEKLSLTNSLPGQSDGRAVLYKPKFIYGALKKDGVFGVSPFTFGLPMRVTFILPVRF